MGTDGIAKDSFKANLQLDDEESCVVRWTCPIRAGAGTVY